MDLSVVNIVIDLVLGVVIGFLIGLTGVGGGSLVIPALTMIVGLPSTAAVGTASLYAFLTKIYAGFEHFRLKTINMKVALVFLIGAVPADIWCSNFISGYKKGRSLEEALVFDQYLNYFIAIVMLISVALMIIDMQIKKRLRLVAEADGLDVVQEEKPLTPKRCALGIIFGAVVGALIGSTSVGGGVIVVPLLVLFFGLRISRTVGTSIFIALVLTLVTALIFGKDGEIDYQTAIVMTMGSLVGVYFGSRLCSRVPEKPLQLLVIGLIVCSSILMLCK